MTSLPPPLTKETFEDIVRSWLAVFNLSESGSVLNFPKREQLYRINQLFDNQALIRKYLSDYSSFQIIPIDLDTLALEDGQDVDSFLNKKVLKKDKRVGLFILSADRLLSEKASLLPYLATLPFKRQNLSLLFLFGTNITESFWLKKLVHNPALYQNIIIHKLYSEKDVDQFIYYLEKKFQASLPKKIILEVKKNCGGHLWFIKQVTRYYLKTKDEKHLFDHEEIKMRLKIVVSEFSVLEKQVLEKILTKTNDFTKEEDLTLDYLVRTGLLEKKRNRYLITIPLLENYLKKGLNAKTQISLNKKRQIVVNKVIMDSCFSKKEKNLLKYLLTSVNKIIQRGEIAKIIWGENYLENYTDWALDQLIKRLRTKLINFGLPKDLIKTVKNQGFILYQ